MLRDDRASGRARGATGFTAIPSHGAGRRHQTNGRSDAQARIHVEVIVPADVCDDIVGHLREEVLPPTPRHHLRRNGGGHPCPPVPQRPGPEHNGDGAPTTEELVRFTDR